MAKTTVARDGCVVPAEPLSSMLRVFASSWERSRPANGGQFSSRRGQRRERRGDLAPVKALEWLAQETRIPATTLDNIMRKYADRPLVELRYADRIVSALGRPDAFHDGTLTIQPNPRASVRARSQCCSGSLTGGLAG